MTLNEAERIINPETSLEAYAECEYYGGFEGSKRWKKAVDEATIIAAQALREKSEREKGCKYCNNGKTLYQETIGTKLYINCSNRARALYFDTKSVNAAYIINYCPNCGRKLNKDGGNYGK